MRILALSSWWPEPADNGARLRISNLLRALAREHEVHLLALAQEPVTAAQRARLAEICASVAAVQQKRWTPSRGALLASLWRREPQSVRATYQAEFATLTQQRAAAIRPDLVIAFHLAAAPYALLIPGTPRLFEEVEALEALHLQVGDDDVEFLLLQDPRGFEAIPEDLGLETFALEHVGYQLSHLRIVIDDEGFIRCLHGPSPLR